MWFWRSSPRSLPASILDALRQTVSFANAEEEAIAPSSGRRSSGRAGRLPPLPSARAPVSDGLAPGGGGLSIGTEVGPTERDVDYSRVACERPFSDRLRKVIDQRVASMAAMLCSHLCRASPVR